MEEIFEKLKIITSELQELRKHLEDIAQNENMGELNDAAGDILNAIYSINSVLF